MKYRLSLVAALLAIVTDTSVAAPNSNSLEVSNGSESGSIVFNAGRTHKKYPDITGERLGVYRVLVSINDQPALYAGLSYDTYYTLRDENKELLIDCAYTDLRNPTNGLRITKAVCGLDEQLTPDYSDLIYVYANDWQKSVSRVDVSPLINSGQQVIISDEVQNGIVVYSSYGTIADLENSTPSIYIKLNRSCHAVGKRTIYLIYNKDNLDTPVRISALESSEPMIIKAVDEDYISQLPEAKCPIAY